MEIKPDGIVYLPEIKYRRILNRAFGPGGWGLAPRSESIVTPKMVTREYALVCHGRYVIFIFVSYIIYIYIFADWKYFIQPRLSRKRRTGLLQPRRSPHRDRRMSIQRSDPLLQGSGHRERTVGSAMDSSIQGPEGPGGLGGACR